MKAEIVAIGNEVLSGSIANTNAAFISRELEGLGIHVSRHTAYPDDPLILKKGLRESLDRYPLVIATGGLGPTCDDLTREVVADLFDSGFRYDEGVALELISRFGPNMSSLKDQSTVPEKAILLPNRIGTAPGLIFQEGSKLLVMVPGVPSEMKVMVVEQLIPFLKKRHSDLSVHVMVPVYLWGMRESDVDPLLRRIKEQDPSVDFGIYPNDGIVSIHVHTDGELSQAQKAAQEIQTAFKSHSYRCPSGKIAEAVYLALKERNETLSTAESFTGGSIAASLVEVAGVSEVFLGSVVAYANEIKEGFLGVSQATLKAHGAVSAPAAEEMLKGILSKSGSSWGIATTGIAGPAGGSDRKPVGTAFIVIGARDQKPFIWEGKFIGARSGIIVKATHRALGELYRLVNGL